MYSSQKVIGTGFSMNIMFTRIKCVIFFWIKFAFFYFKSLSNARASTIDKKIVVYTANFGSYDSLPYTVEQTFNVDWVCFTDTPTSSKKWRCILENKPMSGYDNRMKAKWYKINSHKIDVLQDYDYSIYIDSSAVICNPRFVEKILLATESIGLFLHSERSSIIDEALVSQAQRKYRGLDLVLQASNYVDEMGKDSVLWAGGVIVRKSDVSRLNEHWWSCMDESPQDQISLPIALYRSSTVASKLPGSIFKNPYIMFWTCHRMFEHRTD